MQGMPEMRGKANVGRGFRSYDNELTNRLSPNFTPYEALRVPKVKRASTRVIIDPPTGFCTRGT